MKMFFESQNASYFIEDVVTVTVIKSGSCFSFILVNLYFFFKFLICGDEILLLENLLFYAEQCTGTKKHRTGWVWITASTNLGIFQ